MAPNYVSPGVYTVQKDISEFTPSVNTSIVGIVGFASKGPTNKATLITDQESLIRTFGEPSESINGQGLEGALEILEQTNSVYFIRCADDEVAVDASATMSLGHCPAIAVSGQGDNLGTSRFGIERPVTLRIQVKDSQGIVKFSDNAEEGRDYVVSVPNARSQSQALRSVIGGALDADLVGVFDDGSFDSGLGLSGAIVGSFAGSGAELTAKICEGTTFDANNGIEVLQKISPVVDSDANYGIIGSMASSITVGGAQIATTGTNNLSYLVQSLHPGAGYNGGIKSNGDTSGNSITLDSLGSQNFVVAVNEQGVALETFKASLVASGAFLEDVINTGETNITSRVIKGNITRDGADVSVTALTKFSDSVKQLVTGTFRTAFEGVVTAAALGGRFVKLVGSAATNLAGGTNGIAATENGRSTALIGDATTEPKTGMQALDDDVINVGVALVPGIATEAVQNNLIT